MDPNTQDNVQDNTQVNTEDNAQELAAPTVNTPSTSTVASRYRSFDRYLRIIQKQVHPTCKISESSIRKLNSIVMSLFYRIASEAKELAKKQKRPTLLLRDIEYACRLTLPRELHTEARAAGETAVAKYEESLKRKAARRI